MTYCLKFRFEFIDNNLIESIYFKDFAFID